MRISVILYFLLPSMVFACPDLEGKWKSSKQLSMEFNDNWANIEERSREFHSQITGTTSIEYTGREMIISHIPIRKIVVNGKEMDWHGTNEKVEYQILGCTKNTVAIKYRIFDQDFISLLNFENDDLYWEYSGRVELTGNAHIREYFVRENTLNKANH